MKCPVCGNDTFDDKDYEFDICPECFWEYDILQVDELDYKGGANCQSLNEYKKIYWKLNKHRNDFDGGIYNIDSINRAS